MNYYIKVTKKESSTGCWNTNLCEIFRVDLGQSQSVKIGEYIYGYSCGAENIFCPFRYKDNDYALFSGKDYTTVSIMRLPSCEIVELSEESKKSLADHCPTEIVVPKYKKKWWDDYKFWVYYPEQEVNDSKQEDDIDNEPLLYHDFALVAGCVWGDDSGNWKVNFLDLKDLDRGEVRYNKGKDESWLYEELGLPTPLKEQYQIDADFNDDGNFNNICLQLAIMKRITIL